METFVSPSYNATQKILTTRKMLLAITFLLIVTVFLFFILIMFYVFFTTARLRQQMRYILFVYILVTDTVNITLSVLLFFLHFAVYRIPASGCYFIIIITMSIFYSSRAGLAAMAVERYVAICFPLRHAVICRVERSWIVILAVSAIGFLPLLIDILILSSSAPHNFFFQRLICSREYLILIPQQKIVAIVTDAFLVTVVALIILYTYINILLEAKKMSVDKASSSKASKTVMLHAVQLLLSLTSFTDAALENLLQQVDYFRLLNFFIFLLFPMFLSPFIYGFRDENFKIPIQHCFTCQLHKTHRANS